uniref:Uncharacterized protein n=1 Tax=Arundo donax TaxID=35708 RepID=A0A0A8ZFZ9_ARUDO
MQRRKGPMVYNHYTTTIIVTIAYC